MTNHGDVLLLNDRSLPGWARSLLNGVRGRLAKELENSTSAAVFTEEQFRALWDACGGRCTVSGLPFSLRVVGTGKARRPFKPSIDRIDRRKPHTPDNVRLVCAIANFAMNAWGEEPLIQLAEGIVRHNKKVSRSGFKDRWREQQQQKISIAEQQLNQMKGKEHSKQKRRIAALKRNLTLGPAELRRISRRAAKNRKKRK